MTTIPIPPALAAEVAADLAAGDERRKRWTPKAWGGDVVLTFPRGEIATLLNIRNGWSRRVRRPDKRTESVNAWAHIRTAEDCDPDDGTRALILDAAHDYPIGKVGTLRRGRTDGSVLAVVDETEDRWYVISWATLPDGDTQASPTEAVTRTVGSLTAADLGRWIDVAGEYWAGRLYRIDLTQGRVGIHLSEQKPGGPVIHSAWFPAATLCAVTAEEPS